jgi:hypothetical protein
MTFFHVLAVIENEKPQMLFSDLNPAQLKDQFVTPYKRGKTFFAGARIVSPSTLKSIHIIETTEREEVIRQSINTESLQGIDEINRSGSVIFFSIGSGYDPEDLLDGGADVTRKYLTGGPGSAVPVFGMSKQAIGWALGIVSAVAAAGLAKWLGWA